ASLRAVPEAERDRERPARRRPCARRSARHRLQPVRAQGMADAERRRELPRRRLETRMTRPPPRAVLFDLDGTLIDSAPDLIAAVEALCHELGAPPPDPARVREVVSAGGRAMLRRGLPGADETMIDQWLPRFLDIYSANMVRHTRLYDGVGAMLEGFEARGIAWGVVT